jgi:putative transposase
VARARNGEAIPDSRKTPAEVRKLRELLKVAEREGDLAVWRRARCVLGYIGGKSVIRLSVEVDVTRGSINRWLQWYRARGADGLRTRTAPGASPKLNAEQREELVRAVEAGPQAAGFTSGMWTGPMIGDWIKKRFGVRYHNHHVPYLLHQLGFSVQRPRKRLARADADAQAHWLRVRLPAIKKKPLRAAES